MFLKLSFFAIFMWSWCIFKTVDSSGIARYAQQLIYMLENSTVVVDCVADHPTNPKTAEWYYGNSTFSLYANKFLHYGRYHTFENVKRTDMKYGKEFTFCFVSHNSGSGYHGITLYAVFPPDNIHLEKVQDDEKIIKLVCTVEAYPQYSLSIEWLKDGSKIENEESISMEHSRNRGFNATSTLTINKTKNVSFDGTYICRPINELGYTRAEIKLGEKQPSHSDAVTILSGTLNTVNVVENKTAVLECLVEGNPSPKVSWKIIEPNSNSRSVDGSVLIIDQVQRKDALSTYECSADNGVGSTQTKKTALNVVFPPRNLKMWYNETTDKRGRKQVTVYCSAECNPHFDIFDLEYEFYWYSETKMTDFYSDTSSPTNVEGDKTTSWVVKKGRTDNDVYGTYSCLVRNLLGIATTNITIPTA